MSKRTPNFISILLIFSLFLTTFFLTQPVRAASDLFANPATTVFINEIHYDNASTDTGEAIEIAGPAGTDLTGWSIVLYNGNGGGVYDTDVLTDVITDQLGGYGTVVMSYPSNGIQNGSPDGIALVNGTVVVQFLSYEGSFVAVGGPADGLTSTDIGVSQAGTEAIGSSLQLTGSGETYGDFIWTATSANTFGNPNTGQTFGASNPPTIVLPLVINEILADPSATAGDANGDGTIDTTQDEFVEIVNSTASSIDISGWTLNDAIGVRHTFPAGTLIPANCSVIVFGGGTPSGTFGNSLVQTASTGMLGLNNGGDTVSLFNGASSEGTYTYGAEGGNDTSLTRDPDITGVDPLVLHTAATGSNGALFSAGTKVDGSQFSGCPTVISTVKIHDVQGNGSASPLVGQTVTIEGIVVGDFQDGASGTNGDLNGFNVQEEDADADADPLTSEGVFVYDGSSPAVNVQIGDLVRVEGSVSEYNGLTEISSFGGVTVLSSGSTLPTAAVASLPVASADDFEAFEGMLVTFPQPLVISEYFNFDRFGEIVLTSERHLTPTAEFEPGSPEQQQAVQDYLLDRITLDDGRTNQNPDPAIHPNGGVFDLTNLFRGGDTVANVTGVMDYAFSLYRIQPTQGADYSNENPRTSQPDEVGGNLKVSSFNVLNYFTTLDDSGPICGPLEDQDCRGADNAEEFTRQRDKIIAALTAIDADVVGLIEIENNPGDVPTADLVSGLNDVLGTGTYDYVATGAIGTDAIRVAYIYKPASVSLVGDYAILDATVDPRFLDDFNRPVLAQTFMDNSTGGVFTVALNHLKSKGSDCNAIGDPDTGDGAGNCNLTRKAAAEALVDWLASDPTGSGDEDFLIMGDLNSYDKEDPIDAILAGGYTDLVYQNLGEDAYSYVFDGQTGYLDHALANAGLVDEVTGVTIWHINADEPDLIDYDTSFKGPNQDAIYAPDAYRSSDHDPVIIGLDVCDEIAPTFDEMSVTPDMLWPANHKYVDVTATVVVSDNFDPNPTVELVSVESNEPDEGLGDGDTTDDIVILDDFHFKLRSERSGMGTGRIYTITYMVTDACGNEAYATVTVSVPHNKK